MPKVGIWGSLRDATDGLAEVEVNPLIATPTGAVAVDALIRRAEAQNA